MYQQPVIEINHMLIRNLRTDKSESQNCRETEGKNLNKHSDRQ